MPNFKRASASREASTSSASSTHSNDRRTISSSFSTPATTSSSRAALVSVMAMMSARNNNNIHNNRKPSSVTNDASYQTPSPLVQFARTLVRKKPLDGRTGTKLNRCLNLLDLTTLGVGSTLGLGLYVLAGQVASNKAGPAVVVSFALAALASAFSALCYAEFAGRVPRAGSAYAYSYITVGEFCAFIIGWNLILEYVIGASSVARGFSGYLRFVYEHVIDQIKAQHHESSPNAANTATVNAKFLTANQTNTTTNTKLLADSLLANGKKLVVSIHATELASNLTGARSEMPLDSAGLWAAIVDYVREYFDWISIAIVVVLTIFILFGVKESTNFTMVFTAVNLIVVLTVVISSLGSLDLHNWQLKKEELPKSGNYGQGGFMPFGWSGVLAGSATCFFGFIGFDTIASSAEEAKNPKKNVPLSIILSLFVSFLAYMAIAIVQTLLWPYYAQDNITILPYIFAQLNMPITYWIVLIGAVAGLASSQLGGMYPLPRILYSMAQDKLIYGSLATVNKRLKLPVRATIVGSVFVALLACLLDIQDLADMVSIGTLAAYSLVSLSVLIIRYEDRSDSLNDSTLLSGRLSFKEVVTAENKQQTNGTSEKIKDQFLLFDKEDWRSARDPERSSAMANLKLEQSFTAGAWPLSSAAAESDLMTMKPTDCTSRKSKVYITCIVVATILLNLIVISLTSWTKDNLNETSSVFTLRSILAYSGVAIGLLLIFVVYKLSNLPTSVGSEQDNNMFMVPLVPITPTLSMLVNTFLMLNLSYLTWVRFTVWMAIGLFIYFSYGFWHSEGYYINMDNESIDEDDNKQ